MTKRHETILRGDAADLLRRLGAEVRGEITLVLAGAGDEQSSIPVETEGSRVLECWRQSLRETSDDRRQALRLTARRLGLGRAELYRRLTELKEEIEDSSR